MSVVSCILFGFYIKPQPWSMHYIRLERCILFGFYIKPQLIAGDWYCPERCILFGFYIKPQLSLLTTQSHHLLYLIWILHQTTT